MTATRLICNARKAMIFTHAKAGTPDHTSQDADSLRIADTNGSMMKAFFVALDSDEPIRRRLRRRRAAPIAMVWACVTPSMDSTLRAGRYSCSEPEKYETTDGADKSMCWK